MRTRIVAIILVVVFLGVISGVRSYAGNQPVNANNPTIYINDKKLTFSGQGPLIMKGQVLVPVRGLFEALGAKVTWYSAKRQVLVVKGQTKVELAVGSTRVLVNNKSASLKTAPQMINNRVMVPLEFTCQALGYTYNYNNWTNKIVILNDVLPDSFEYQGQFFAKTQAVYSQSDLGTVKYVLTVEGLEVFAGSKVPNQLFIKSSQGYVGYAKVSLEQ